MICDDDDHDNDVRQNAWKCMMLMMLNDKKVITMI